MEIGKAAYKTVFVNWKCKIRKRSDPTCITQPPSPLQYLVVF